MLARPSFGTANTGCKSLQVTLTAELFGTPIPKCQVNGLKRQDDQIPKPMCPVDTVCPLTGSEPVCSPRRRERNGSLTY